MKIRINVETSSIPIKSYYLSSGTYIIGSASTEIPLQYPTVSKKHGEVTIDPNQVLYRDLSSRNGSKLNGSSLGCVQTTWQSDSALEIGPFRLTWQKAQSCDEPNLDSRFIELGALYSKLLAENPARAQGVLQDSVAVREDERALLLDRIHHEFHGDGPLKNFIHSKECREIIINGFNKIYVDLGEGLTQSKTSFLSPESFEAWAVRTAHEAGRRLDLQNPVCEATLSDGARFHAVMPPVSAQGLSVAIRRFGSAPIEEETALATGWMTPDTLKILKHAIVSKQNIVISGGTSTGKTSLLNFLCQYLDRNERVLTVEDTVELAPPIENLVQLQARTANADGIGQITLRQLVQCALRMRPDRIIVGECRGAEVIEMLQALNTGHPGSLTTVHANSTAEALQRLELLALLGAPNLSVECIREWIRSSVDLVVQVERDREGRRYVSEISEKRNGRFEFAYQHNTY